MSLDKKKYYLYYYNKLIQKDKKKVPVKVRQNFYEPLNCSNSTTQQSLMELYRNVIQKSRLLKNILKYLRDLHKEINNG